MTIIGTTVGMETPTGFRTAVVLGNNYKTTNARAVTAKRRGETSETVYDIKFLDGDCTGASGWTESDFLPPAEETWFHCGNCGYWDLNSELIPDEGEDDPDVEIKGIADLFATTEPHPCGKDECPSCHAKGCICCCISTAVKDAYDNWDNSGDEGWPGFDEMEERLASKEPC